jgi:hypothetical protein
VDHFLVSVLLLTGGPVSSMPAAVDRFLVSVLLLLTGSPFAALSDMIDLLAPVSIESLD